MIGFLVPHLLSINRRVLTKQTSRLDRGDECEPECAQIGQHREVIRVQRVGAGSHNIGRTPLFQKNGSLPLADDHVGALFDLVLRRVELVDHHFIAVIDKFDHIFKLLGDKIRNSHFSTASLLDW